MDGVALLFDDALKLVREKLAEQLGEDFDNAMGLNKEDSKDGIIIKDKSYLRKKKEIYKKYISDIVYGNSIKVLGYMHDSNRENDKTKEDFIKEMVEEFAGYSILAGAFEKPSISDIFVIDWETIFVEDDGVNVRYPHKFRSQKAYEDFVARLLRENNKTVNNGDSKIVDFEVYGDRGCVTSTAVSPRDITLTMRKHAEDHIKRDNLLNWGVLNKTQSTFMGTVIRGECNVVYAGLTGSGKTTTIRALLDYYVSSSNKRMLVCEDTQELFSENEHTVALVSNKTDDPKTTVTLQQLIYTALRVKPKYIVIGEVRGAEAQAAVEGMETGHSTIFTMHGGNPWNIINRLVTKYLMAMPSLGIDVVERIIGSAVDYICIQDNIPGIGRKLSSISEISYDFPSKRVVVTTICQYDFIKRDFEWKHGISKEKVDKMLRRGVPMEELVPWQNLNSICAIDSGENKLINEVQEKIEKTYKENQNKHKKVSNQ